MRVSVAVLALGMAAQADAFAPSAGVGAARLGLTPSKSLAQQRPRAAALSLKATAAIPLGGGNGGVQEAPAAEQPGQLAEWRQNLDLKGWATEMRAIEDKYRNEQGEADVKHLNKMLNWSYVLYGLGLATAGWAALPWNPISALCISTAICMRWTMIGHHVGHGGYSKTVGRDHRFHRANFAKGPVRRFMDWCDWMLPEAWDVEHNHMHHYELGESSDPDLLERNAYNIREGKYPTILKTISMIGLMTMWKWFYYTPNTLKEMFDRHKKIADRKGKGDMVKQPFVLPPAPGPYGSSTKAATIKYVFSEMAKLNFFPAKVLFSTLAPYFTAHFVITPLVFYVLFGQAVAMTAFINLFVAEILTNIHSFAIIVPNHTGKDIYRFETPVQVKSDEFYLRACIGSTNYKTGGNVNDCVHGWLNYQIEHHMFPDMSMLSYQKMAPEVKQVCEKYGVPYVQENVFKRIYKTWEIFVGKTNMKVWEKGH